MIFSDFWKKTSIVLLGTICAQAIPIIILPYLTRTLNSDIVGVYLLWLSVSAIIVCIGICALDQAIFIAKNNKEVDSIYRTLFILSLTILSVMLVFYKLLCFFFSHKYFPSVINEFKYSLLIYGFAMILMQGYSSYLVYNSRFISLSVAKVVVSLFVGMGQVLLVYIGWGIDGVIYAQSILTLIIVFYLLLKDGVYPFNFTADMPIRKVIEKYRNFVIFSTPANIVNTVSGQLPLMLIAAKFGLSAAGFYGLANKILTVPSGLLSSSIMTVFKDDAGVEYRRYGQCKSSYIRILKRLLIISVFPFTILFFSADLIFVTIFGSEWVVAGHYARIMIPFVFIGFIVSPLSYTLLLAQKQKENLVWQIGLLVLTFVVFNLKLNIVDALKLYSMMYSFMYFIYLWMSYKASKGC